MKDEKLEQLESELRQAGAGVSEAADLSRLAFDLKKLKKYQVQNQDTKQFRLRLLRPYFAGALLLAIVTLPIIWAQSVQPTNWLFPVQKAADSVAVSVHPGYRADVMMKRSEQVNNLVASGANERVILATLADYTAQAKSYEKMPHTSYAAMEYCETNLKQAAAVASPKIKNAIHASLDSLES